jgi:hypothetical protein
VHPDEHGLNPASLAEPVEQTLGHDSGGPAVFPRGLYEEAPFQSASPRVGGSPA